MNAVAFIVTAVAVGSGGWLALLKTMDTVSKIEVIETTLSRRGNGSTTPIRAVIFHRRFLERRAACLILDDQ